MGKLATKRWIFRAAVQAPPLLVWRRACGQGAAPEGSVCPQAKWAAGGPLPQSLAVAARRKALQTAAKRGPVRAKITLLTESLT